MLTLRFSAFYPALCSLILLSSVPTLRSQHIDYRQEFGESYSEAMSYLLENTWMMDTIARHGRDPAFVLAIVFPELIRYAQLRDRIEMLALSTLYVQYGDKYADFSVGRFQMKPSFARQIEEDCPEVFRKRLGIAGQDPVSDRRERLDRLRKPESQLRYLLCFCEIMDQRFKEYIWPHEEARLQVYATAYHFGYNKDIEDITKAVSQHWYHLSPGIAQRKYPYPEVSLYLFRRIKKH